MQKKRQKRLSNRRRAEVVTRKAQLAELKEAHFADMARQICASLEPYIEQLVKDQVSKAMMDFAERCGQRPS